jgi:biopolymer transport protein TolQ
MTPETLGVVADVDYSLWGLYLRATFTVKLVMISLILASVWGWAIIIGKLITYRQARAEARRFDAAFWSGEPLDELFDQIGDDPDAPSEKVFASGMIEWRRSQRDDGRMIPGAEARIDRSMDVAITKEAESLNKGLPLLATIGSTAPFVGLFGTVWGIMNAFIEIAEQQSTNLAVVAPGIAEALLATGLGLLAAIPAVIFYNKLSSDSERIVAGYEAFADEFATILSRQVES